LQPAWHTIENVNMTAINDALMIENGIYFILSKHFGNLPCYHKLIELFHESIFITTIGQSLDQQSAILEVDKFTMDIYKAIVKNKTSHYTFYLPVALSMHLAG
jgi:farnesyl diphosphate synthase